MEYLPEKKRTQKAQVLKKEDKTRQFREYLANNDVVLSMVKCKCTLTPSLTHNQSETHEQIHSIIITFSRNTR